MPVNHSIGETDGEIDIELLAALHRERRLFVGYQLAGADLPCTLTLDGDAHQLVDRLLADALIARTERARARRRHASPSPARRLGPC